MSIVDMDFTGLYLCFEDAQKKALEIDRPVLAAFSCSVATVDTLSLLEKAQHSEGSYAFWESRHPSLSMFGWGGRLKLVRWVKRALPRCSLHGVCFCKQQCVMAR